jgi:purine-binding chemotaxis protein CheW
MTPERHFCTFRLDGALYGIGVGRVREVVSAQALTPVPLAPPAVRGLINLRGEIVPVIDLRTRLELPPRDPGETPVHVVVATEWGLASLLVDAIEDILEVHPETWAPTPASVRGAPRDLVGGVYQLADRLLLVLDADHAAGVHDGAIPREDLRR